jgi:hypothetical protein
LHLGKRKQMAYGSLQLGTTAALGKLPQAIWIQLRQVLQTQLLEKRRRLAAWGQVDQVEQRFFRVCHERVLARSHFD